MTDELDRQIERLAAAVAALGAGDPGRVAPLADLAAARATRFRRSGDPTDLDAAAAALVEATAPVDWIRYLAAIAAGSPARVGTAVTLIQQALARASVAIVHAVAAEPTDPRQAAALTAARRVLLEIANAREALQAAAATFALDSASREPGAPPSEAVRRGPAAPPTPAGDSTPGFGASPPPPGTVGRAGPPSPAPWLPAPMAPAPAAPMPWFPAPAAAAGRVEFAAAYRRVVERKRRYPVLFFVHRADARDQVQEIINRRAAALGGDPTVARGVATKAVADGTTLTIVPNVVGVTFEPASIEVATGAPLRELTFQATVGRDLPAGELGGYVDIFVGPLVIGQVPLAFEVTAAASAGEAQLLEVASARIFDKIFVSYSRKDSALVDACVNAYQSMGVEVLMDRLELHSGDDWRASLERMITQSDIFQLYWSTSSAASGEVATEWKLALALSPARDRFIRPLYWETPLPPAPAELGHLHFARVDVKALRRALTGKRGLLSRLLGRR